MTEVKQQKPLAAWYRLSLDKGTCLQVTFLKNGFLLHLGQVAQSSLCLALGVDLPGPRPHMRLGSPSGSWAPSCSLKFTSVCRDLWLGSREAGAPCSVSRWGLGAGDPCVVFGGISPSPASSFAIYNVLLSLLNPAPVVGNGGQRYWRGPGRVSGPQLCPQPTALAALCTQPALQLPPLEVPVWQWHWRHPQEGCGHVL